MDGGVIASTRPTRRGRRPWHVRTLFVRESGDLGFGQRRNTVGPHREGEEPKPMMHEPEKSDFAIVCAEQRMNQEGLSPSGARMRSAVSKSGGNASLAEARGRYGDVS